MEENTWHLTDGEDPTFIDDREKSTELSCIYSRINSEKLCVEEAKITEDWNRGDIILDLYEVEGILGEGAFGRVYKVYHRGWNSYLAVKTLHSHLVSSEEHKKSFIKECQGWVNLGIHPNIVSCYYVRDLGGLPRIFLEYIDGGNLSAELKKNKNLNEILDYAIQCLDGLTFAHNKGLIHRDIKPLNCLLTTGGDLKITDFGIASGLAKFDGEKGNRENSIIENPAGTPAYMPPEQWSHGTAGPWNDIYSFGVMLYEMCCRRRPFDEGSEPVVVLKARHLTMEPENPRKINKNIPQNLSDFILKCLAKKPEERYKNCEDARAELIKIYEFIAHKPYGRKKAQEARLLADGLNNRAVSMIDLGKKNEAEKILNEALKTAPSHPQSLYNRGILMWRSGKITDVELIRQMEEAGKSNSKDYIILYLTSLIHMERGNSSQAIKLLKEASHMAGSSDREADKKEIEKTLNKALEQVNQEDSVKIFKGHTGWVNSVSISSDEKTGISGSQDGTIKLWNLSDGTYIKTLKGHTNFITSVSMSSDGTKGLSGSRDKTIRLWNLKSGECIRTFQGHKGPVNSVNISSDGTLAISGADKIIYIWDVKSGLLIKELEGHSDSVESVCISPDRTCAISGSKDKTVRLWDLKSGTCIKTMEGHMNRVNSVSISSDGNFAISGSGSEIGTKDNTIRLWDLRNGQSVNMFRGHSNFISSLSFSCDGRFILSGSEDRTIRIWNRETGQCIRTFDSSTGISSVCMSQSGRFALFGSRKFSSMSSEDIPLHLWNLEHGNQGAFMVVKPQSSVKAIEDAVKFDNFLKEGEELFKKGAYSEVLKIIDKARNLPGYEQSKTALDLKYKVSVKGIRQGLNTAWFLKNFEGHKNKVTSISITSDDRFVLSGSQDKTIGLWDLEKGQFVKNLEGHSRSVTSLCLSSDGVFALSGSEDNTLRMWLIENGTCLKVFEGHKSGVTSVCISRGGDYALSGSWDKTIRLWDLEKEKCLKIFTGHTESVTSLCLSSDGEFFLSGSMDKTIRLWNIRKGICTKILEGHNDIVTSISISRDDKFLLSGSKDGTMCLWDLEKGLCIKTFKGQRGAITSLSFLPDGKFSIAGQDSKLLIWDLQKGIVIRTLEGHMKDVSSLFITSEGRFVLSGSDDTTIRIYELDWDYEFPQGKDLLEGIRPYLEIFLHNRGGESEEEFQTFLVTLGQCGYGWVSEEEVRKEVEKLKATFKRQTPLIEYVTKPVLSKSDIEKFDSLLETKSNKVFEVLKEKNKLIVFTCAGIITVILFILLTNILSPGNRIKTLIEKLKSSDKEKQNYAIKSLVKAGESAVDPLILALKDENSTTREMAARTLGEIGSERAVEPLIVLLGDLYPSVQEASVKALVRTGKPSIEPLIKELNNKSSTVRKNAITALGDIGNSSAVKPLIPLLIDEISEVRIKAKEVIRKFDKNAVIFLIASLENEKPSIREISAEILGEIKDPACVEPLILKLKDKEQSVREKSLKAIINTGEASVEILTEHLQDKDNEIRKNVIFAIGEISKNAAPLIPLIKDKDSEIRRYTAEALGKTGDGAAAETLINLFLYDKDEKVKESALNALRVKTITEGSIPLISRYREEEIKKIAEALKDELTVPLVGKLSHNTEEKIKAVKILGLTGNNLCINPLIEVLKDKNPKVRKAVIESLGKFYNETIAVKAIKASEKDRDIEVRNSAANMLKEMVKNCIKSLSESNDTAIWKKDLRTIGESGDITAVKPLIDFVQNKISSYEEVDFASEALANMGKPAVKPLIEMLEYGRNDAKICAINALGKIKDTEAVDPLIKTFYDYEGEKARIEIVTALGKIGSPAPVKMLIETMKGYGGVGLRVRIAAAEALGETGSVDAVKPLEEKGSDVNESVELRDTARKALGKIKMKNN